MAREPMNVFTKPLMKQMEGESRRAGGKMGQNVRQQTVTPRNRKHCFLVFAFSVNTSK